MQLNVSHDDKVRIGKKLITHVNTDFDIMQYKFRSSSKDTWANIEV